MAAMDRGRLLRRRHLHERQAVVFGGLVAGLAVAGLAAAAFYTGAIDAPFLAREFASPSPTATTGPSLPPPPCPPAGTLPVAYNAVAVNVLNASQVAGLAGRTGNDLVGRGFVVASTGNYPTQIEDAAEIYFGEAGLAQAYTLASHVPGATLVLDTRPDASVDLVLGAGFAGLADPATVALDPSVELVGVAGCVPLEQAAADAVPGPTPSATEDAAVAGDPAADDQTDSNPGPDGEQPPPADG